MSHDDFEMVAYRILRLLDACMKAGVSPTLSAAEERAEAGNARYFASVLTELVDSGYVAGVSVEYYYDGFGEPAITFDNARITLKGAEFLRDNGGMQKARKAAGVAFESAVEKTVALLLSLSLGA